MKIVLKPFEKMSSKEKAMTNDAIHYVGRLIGHVVELEERINTIICYFFDARKTKNKHMEIFLEHFMLPRLDFSVKVGYLDQMVKILATDNNRFTVLNSLLSKLLELRNLVAHQPFMSNTKDLHFVKKEFVLETIGNRPAPRISPPVNWVKAYRNIIIPQTRKDEIIEQFKISREFLIILEDFFNVNKRKKPFRTSLEIKSFLESEDVKNLTNKKLKLGVFGINLKE